MRVLFSIILTFALTAISIAAPPVPVVGASGNGVQIDQANDPATDPDSGTNFGTLQVATTGHPHVFAVHNFASQGGVLKIDQITVTGTNPNDFIITVPPIDLNVGRGESELFTVAFNPTAEGTRSAIINIESDDPVTPVFSFNIAGEGVSSLPSQPDLHVVLKAKPKYSSKTPGLVRLKGKATVYNLGTTTSLAGSLQIYHWGTVPLSGAPTSLGQVPFGPIAAPLPGKKPKKVKVSFDVSFASLDHAAFFRATSSSPNDLDTTDNFVSMIVEP